MSYVIAAYGVFFSMVFVYAGMLAIRANKASETPPNESQAS